MPWGLHAAPVRRWEVATGIIAWINLGAIAGFITNLIMGGGEGVIVTVIFGIVGAVVGGYLAGTVLDPRVSLGGVIRIVGPLRQEKRA